MQNDVRLASLISILSSWCIVETSKTLLDFLGTNDSVVSLFKPNKVDPIGRVLLAWNSGGMSDLSFRKVLT